MTIISRRRAVAATLSLALLATGLLAGGPGTGGFGALSNAARADDRSSDAPTTIRVGVTPGPHARILEAVRPVAAERGLAIEIIEFSDYVIPNQALDAGEIEANSFQHAPYLENQTRDRGYAIAPIAKTVTFPLGVYSARHASWADLPDGALVAIQNDPTNGGRSLLLLRDAGAIGLREGVGLTPTVLDVVDNPKNLRFVEIDAAQAPRSLPDVDAAAINTNYAVEAGLEPADAILREDPDGPYVNLIAVREADASAPWAAALAEAYRSPEVKAFIEETFGGAVLASW